MPKGDASPALRRKPPPKISRFDRHVTFHTVKVLFLFQALLSDTYIPDGVQDMERDEIQPELLGEERLRHLSRHIRDVVPDDFESADEIK